MPEVGEQDVVSGASVNVVTGSNIRRAHPAGENDVAARATLDTVCARIPEDDVVACQRSWHRGIFERRTGIGENLIIAGSAMDPITACAAFEPVVARSAPDDVVAPTAVDVVCSITSADVVIAWCAPDRVVAGGAEDELAS